jgi:hypothetical protein
MPQLNLFSHLWRQLNELTHFLQPTAFTFSHTSAMKSANLAAHDLIDIHGRYAAGEALMRAINSTRAGDENYWLTIVGIVMDIQKNHHHKTDEFQSSVEFGY